MTSAGAGAGACARASEIVAQPTPMRPCRGQPVKKPIAIGISSGVSCARNAASVEILSSLPGLSATARDTSTSSMNF